MKKKHQLELDNDVIIGPICKVRAARLAHPDYKSIEPFRDTNGRICMQHAIVKQDAADDLMNHLTAIWCIR
jgi:hypothetical protein